MLLRSSQLPLYRQLKQLLVDRIERGEYRPGDLIPGEHELQDSFRLSRTTVRQAMQELERAGYVTRHRGRGTFVAEAPRAGVGHSLHAQGLRGGLRLLAADTVPAPDDVAARLQLPPGSQVFRSRRLRLADDQPIGYLVAHVSAELSAEIDPTRLADDGSLDYLRGGGVLAGSRAERTLEAALADIHAAEALGIAPGEPVLKIHRLLVAADGRPLEDSCGTYRGDRFRYRVAAGRELERA
jgi:GntR family transcriptional regulator